MPYGVKKSGSKSKPWAIYNLNTGKTVGRSTTKQKAHQSASIRNSAHK